MPETFAPSPHHERREGCTPAPSAIAATSLDTLAEQQRAAEDANSAATLLRDSAIVLAAATALLYLTGHVFSSAYLGFFEVRNFDAFGLGALALLGYPFIVALGLFVYGLRTALCWKSPLGIWTAFAAILATGSARPLTVIGYGADISGNDFRDAFGAVLVGITLRILWGAFGRTRTMLSDSMASTRAALKNAHKRALENTSPGDEVLDASALKATVGYLNRRLRMIGVATWLFSGYATMLVAVPALAWGAAIDAVQQEGYQRIDDNSAPRLPVYWIGDRVIFLTLTNGCSVYTQIAGVTQSKRSCGRNIRAVVNVIE